MKVSIHHIIDQTSKEIYEFEKVGNTWNYVGIYYSHRNDESDIWGDEWDKNTKLKNQELNEYALSRGYEDYMSLVDDYRGYYAYESEIQSIFKKYNPVYNKTNHGKTYWSGIYWGYNDHDGQHTPKLSEEQLKDAILQKISTIEIKL